MIITVNEKEKGKERLNAEYKRKIKNFLRKLSKKIK